MKVFSILLALVTLTSFATAKAEENELFTKMKGVVLRCSIQGAKGLEENQFGFNHKAKRAWLTQEGINVGMELEISSYDEEGAKCFGCHTLRANLLGNDISLLIEATGPKSGLLTGTLKSENNHGRIETAGITGTCVAQ